MAMSRAAAELEAAGAPVLHLELGQPSTAAPRAVRAAAAMAMDTTTIGYTPATGLSALRHRIAAHIDDWYSTTVDPERVVVVAGASAGFSLTFLAAFDPGDRVGVLEPGYPCYRNTLEVLGCVPVGIPVGPDTRWAPSLELLERAGPLDGLVIASPSNPTGTVTDLGPIVEHCRANGVRLVSDEIYHGITYDGARVQTATAFDPTAVVINSFSKYFSMTGWRLGWVVAPDDLHDAFERLQQNLYICAPTLSQHAAVAAFDAHEELAAHVVRYADHRSLMLDGLGAAGLAATADADGAFYVYADVSHLTDDSMGLCRRWLAECHVAATPGVDFDPRRGRHHVRFSYAGARADVVEACDRLAGWQA